MHKLTVDDIEPEPEGDMEIDRRNLGDALETTDLAMNYYVLEPGEAFAGGLHAHLDQEEVFYVLEGTATFETKRDPNAKNELLEVRTGEVVRFAPGEFQQGRNESDEPVVALALGAPKNSVEGRVPKTCPECSDSDYLVTVMRGGTLLLQCPTCETLHDNTLH